MQGKESAPRSVFKKSLNPAQHFAPNTVLVQFPKELTVVDFIERILKS